MKKKRYIVQNYYSSSLVLETAVKYIGSHMLSLKKKYFYIAFSDYTMVISIHKSSR